ncbi:MAG: GTPase, partial [Myxococcota bacterium]
QRFATRDDLDLGRCTIEEREEYEPYVDQGRVVYAGVDYAAILARAEEEADVILWDGGNNDLPFVQPDLHLVLLDPHRPGDARRYYPSRAQVRLADVLLLAKSATADPAAVEAERALAREMNPHAKVIAVSSEVSLQGRDEAALAGRRVVCVEDGPSTTHGGLPYGAATVLARRAGATIVDPRPAFAGTLRDVARAYPDLGPLIPAVGYSIGQRADLRETLGRVDADVVLSGTPIDLAAIVSDPRERPIWRVRYDLRELDGEPSLRRLVDGFLDERL